MPGLWPVVMVALALLAVDITPCHAGVAPVRGIHGAAKRNELGELRRLLGLGVDPNKLTQGKITALMWAAAEGHVEAAEILIAAGADTKPKSSCKQAASQPATATTSCTCRSFCSRFHLLDQLTMTCREPVYVRSGC
jgi:hypothetical protein